MRTRIDAGSDIATIGAWDQVRDAHPFSKKEQGERRTLEREANAGHIFYVEMGGDGGGPVEVVIDETVAEELSSKIVSSSDEFLLLLPTGELKVAGAEDFRAEKPRTSGTKSLFKVPAGEYAVRCHFLKDVEEDPASEKVIEAIVGKPNLLYYDNRNKMGCLFIVIINALIFAGLLYLLRWQFAAVISVVSFVASFHVNEWMTKRDPLYKALDEVVPFLRIQTTPPIMVFELRKIEGEYGLAGGSVRRPEA